MTNIKFPETNLVKCAFCWRSTNMEHTNLGKWDEYDHYVEPNKLKRYTYRVPEHLQGTLCVGDTVLVHCQTGYQICEIVATNVLSDFDAKSFAPVVCKVDLSPYFQEVERVKKLQVMKAAIDREKKRLESMVTYELIAEKNPEFKEMLEAFKEMGGEF